MSYYQNKKKVVSEKGLSAALEVPRAVPQLGQRHERLVQLDRGVVPKGVRKKNLLDKI